MSKAANWADDDGSSDEGSDNEDVPVVEEPVKSAPAPAPAPESKPTHSSRNSGFTVHVSNLPYSVDDITIGNFFVDGQCNVKDVILHVDRETKRSRGTAHVEFEDQASMDKALTANGVDFGGRSISVTVAEDRRGFRGGNDRDRGGRQSGGRGKDRDYQPRGDRRDRKDRDDRRDGSFDNRRGQRGDGFSSGRGGGERSRGEKGDRDRDRDNRHTSRGATSASTSIADGAPSTAPAERPKLNLAPRTLPVEAVGAPVVNPSIFGEGKPRDESKSVSNAVSSPADVPPPAPPTEKEIKAVPSADTSSDARGNGGGRGRGDRRDKDRAGRGRGEGRGDRDYKKGAAGRGERSPRGDTGAARGSKQPKAKATTQTENAPATDALAEKVYPEPLFVEFVSVM